MTTIIALCRGMTASF